MTTHATPSVRPGPEWSAATARSVFHEGERAVQRPAGVERVAAQVGRGITSWIPPGLAEFLRLQPFVILASRDDAGRVWASLIVGGVGFARAIDERRVLLAGAPAAGDPLAVALEQPDARIGLLAIEFDSRKRIRLNGVAQRTADGILLTVEEAFGNCPKFIQRRLPTERLEPGPGGRHRVGAALEPRQAVLVSRAGEHPVVLISAGIGATPVLAMLHALAAVRSEREVWWIHGARSGAEHAFRAESARVLERLPNARRIVAYSAPDIEDRLGRDFDVTGRLTGAALDEAGVPTGADFYLCGPSSFMHDISAALASRGVPPERVRTEIFGPSDVYRPGMFGETERQPHPPDGPPGTGPLVLFSRSNLSVRWDPSFGSLLDLAEACDVPVGFGCRTGVCHLCQSGLISGNVMP